MEKAISIFWNSDEKRLRAFPRIALHWLITMGIISAISNIGVLAIPNANEWVNVYTSPQWVFLNFLTTAGIVLTMYLLGRFVDRRKFIDFGWKLNRQWWLEFGFGFFLAAFFAGLIFAIEYGLGWLKITGYCATDAATSAFWPSLLSSLIFFILVGIQEESISRGYQLKNLAEGFAFLGSRKALAVAIILTSIVFGLIHLDSPHATFVSTLNLTIAGVYYAVAYLLTGRLAIPIGFHIAWNFFEGSVFGFPVSGYKIMPNLISIEQAGPDLLTGGAFGPEAGLLRLGALVIQTLLILVWVHSFNGSIKPERDMTALDKRLQED